MTESNHENPSGLEQTPVEPLVYRLFEDLINHLPKWLQNSWLNYFRGYSKDYFDIDPERTIYRRWH